MKYLPKLEGSLVFLSPISLDDADRYAEWLNDLSTTRFLHLSSFQVTLHGEREALAILPHIHLGEVAVRVMSSRRDRVGAAGRRTGR